MMGLPSHLISFGCTQIIHRQDIKDAVLEVRLVHMGASLLGILFGNACGSEIAVTADYIVLRHGALFRKLIHLNIATHAPLLTRPLPGPVSPNMKH